MGVPAKKGEVTESGCEIIRFPSIKIQDQYVNDLMDKSAPDKKKRGESRKSTEVDHLTVEDSKRMLEYFESKNSNVHSSYATENKNINDEAHKFYK